MSQLSVYASALRFSPSFEPYLIHPSVRSVVSVCSPCLSPPSRFLLAATKGLPPSSSLSLSFPLSAAYSATCAGYVDWMVVIFTCAMDAPAMADDDSCIYANISDIPLSQQPSPPREDLVIHPYSLIRARSSHSVVTGIALILLVSVLPNRTSMRLCRPKATDAGSEQTVCITSSLINEESDESGRKVDTFGNSFCSIPPFFS